MKKFKHKDTLYTEQQLRKTIFETTRKVLGKPKKGQSEEEFWAKFGVEIVEEEESLDILKEQKAFAIKQAFLRWRNSDAVLISSLGFVADSNERTKSDIESLLDLYESKQDETITFRDANNEFHNLSYDDLKTLKNEIIDNGMFAYQQKWQYDALVDGATSEEELKQIDVKFEAKDYSVKE